MQLIFSKVPLQVLLQVLRLQVDTYIQRSAVSVGSFFLVTSITSMLIPFLIFLILTGLVYILSSL